MLRVLSNSLINRIPSVSGKVYEMQFVRNLRRKPRVRKPIWLGTAKSKIFRFPQHKPYEEGELEELTKLYNDYKSTMKALRLHFKEEYAKLSDTGDIAAKEMEEERQRHLLLMEKNRLENERVAKLREARMAEKLKSKREALLRSFEINEEKDRMRKEEAEALIREQKELSKTFITLEKLDQAIEEALATETDYNFAIDLDGNIYKGRHATKDSKTSEVKSTESQQVLAREISA